MIKFTIEGRWINGKPRYILFKEEQFIPTNEDIRLRDIYGLIEEYGRIVDVTRLGDLFRYVKVEQDV